MNLTMELTSEQVCALHDLLRVRLKDMKQINSMGKPFLNCNAAP